MTADPNDSPPSDEPAVPSAHARGVGNWGVRVGHRLETARQWLDSGGSVLVYGPAGACTSAALDVVTDGQTGRVVACRLQLADAGRRFGALTRLLESVSRADLELVPKARQGVLIALLAGRVGVLSPAAVRIAVLSLLRQLAGQRPVLLRIDDVQHVDPDSADVLRYVMNRVQDLPVRMAVAEQTSGAMPPRHRQLCPSPLLLIGLPTSD